MSVSSLFKRRAFRTTNFRRQILKTSMNFNNMELIAPIIKALEGLGYKTPTDIQIEAIPLILKGNDIIGCAQTGTGKTAAFSIPILQNCAQQRSNSKAPKALILAPTRELAIQIDKTFAELNKHLGLRHLVVFGGVPISRNIKSLQQPVDILIATPGRLLDLINQKYLTLNSIATLVLDEADTMLDMGFIHDIKKILKYVPEKRQTLFFSATMPPEIRKFANTILKNPAEVNINPVVKASENVNQSVFFIEKKQKTDLLVDLLNRDKNLQTLVFIRTKHAADRLAKQLNKRGFKADAIHGNKSQNARQNALESFKTGRSKILIATDIAARGIDIHKLPQVINYDLPTESETYVHRIGRTGRAGNAGHAYSFCSEEEKKALHGIQKLIGFQLETN